MAAKRLGKELADNAKSTRTTFTLEPVGDDLFNWTATLNGPEGTAYEGGRFVVNVEVPTDYPFKPPSVKFATTIWHPNVNSDGSVCMQILKADGWSPSVMLADVCQALLNLIEEPNCEEPLDAEAAEAYTNNREEFDAKVRQMVEEHAM